MEMNTYKLPLGIRIPNFDEYPNGYNVDYDNTPLIKFHADGYFCPTCEKLVSAGDGLDMADDNSIREMRHLFNSPFVSLENSFENLKPLLGLLRTGYYALVDVELYPSDGNGQFFWRVNNTPLYNKLSCCRKLFCKIFN